MLIAKFLYFLLILWCLMSLSACSSVLRNDVSFSDFMETFGEPHILEENICYYMGTWSPGATLLKVRFSGNRILGFESETYDERALPVYIPMLIESLRSEDANIVLGAHSFLCSVMKMTYPNGYGEYYMTDTRYKGTPFETDQIDTDVYQQWKDWWEQVGCFDFQKQASELK